MLNKIYIAIATMALTYYAADGMLGWEYGNPRQQIVPAETRRSPGWSRTGGSHHPFWYSGYRGGK